MASRRYTDEQVIKFAKEVKSCASLIRKLGLKSAGGNFIHMKKTIQRLKIDTSHWTGQLWSKGQKLKDWKDYTRFNSVKRNLINLRGNKCERCGLTMWFDVPIKIEAHHIDGDRTNNSEDNIILLCCNCHSQTNHWRSKK